MKTDDLPKRKSMRLSHYDYSSRGAYFVTVCVQDKQPLLSAIVPDTGISADESSVGVGASTTRECGASTTRECGASMPGGTEDSDASFDGGVRIHLTEIGKTVERHLLASERIPGVRVDRYVIMPDHIHAILLLDSDQASEKDRVGRSPANQMLPRVISALKRLCNRELGQNIFQRGYMEHVIRDSEDYEIRVNYILKNPARRYFKKVAEVQ